MIFRSVLTDNARLTRKDDWQLVPMIIYFMTAIPQAFMPWPDKVEIARTVVADPGYMGIYRAPLFSDKGPLLNYI